tara:strand:+ start:34 stop:228 length:195 start_codon:yes stop_codon:yes gene_type:complete
VEKSKGGPFPSIVSVLPDESLIVGLMKFPTLKKALAVAKVIKINFDNIFIIFKNIIFLDKLKYI